MQSTDVGTAGVRDVRTAPCVSNLATCCKAMHWPCMLVCKGLPASRAWWIVVAGDISHLGQGRDGCHCKGADRVQHGYLVQAPHTEEHCRARHHQHQAELCGQAVVTRLVERNPQTCVSNLERKIQFALFQLMSALLLKCVVESSFVYSNHDD